MLNPAFVIHSRPYRETSQLVEVFTQDSGRFTLVARGSRGPRSPLKGLLQPFSLLTISWRGKGDLKNLTQVECPDHSLRLGGDRLFYGLYLNELVYYLLEAHTPFPEVFDAYARAMDRRVVQVSATISAGLQEVEILRPEGLRLSDIRPMARMNVSVIVEQGGRREQGGTGGGGRFGLARLMARDHFLQRWPADGEHQSQQIKNDQ